MRTRDEILAEALRLEECARNETSKLGEIYFAGIAKKLRWVLDE